MKALLYLSIAFLLILFSSNSVMFDQENRFYYTYSEKKDLYQTKDKFLLRFSNNRHKNISNIDSIIAKKIIEWKDDSTCVVSLRDYEQLSIGSLVSQQENIASFSPIYTNESGLEMGITDEFVVQFKEKSSKQSIDELVNRYKLTIVDNKHFYTLYKVPKDFDVLNVANEFQESGLTVFSHPNFKVMAEFFQVIPNDAYFANQFALNNTGQVFTDGHFGAIDADIDAPEAWVITKGSNTIKIAVLDEGISSDHPDLPNSRQIRLNGSNFGFGDPNNPSPMSNDNHGNACAGTIAATHNNSIGISGIAPNCKILAIRTKDADPTATAAAIDFAKNNGADIISCSWGYPSTDPNFLPVIKTAIQNAVSNGRATKGCIVVFAASNTANHVNGDNGTISFPANVDINGVLTVGASDRYDHQANYSPTSNPSSGSNQIIDICAPSHRAYSNQIPGETFEAWSIDMPSSAGYNPVHSSDQGGLPTIGSLLPSSGTDYLSYTGRFGGTSYACPQISAVAALILSINPNLTSGEVYSILTTTADKVGGYTYTNGRSNELGFGRLNACSAVSKAVKSLIPTITGSPVVCSSGNPYTISPIPTGCPIIWECGPYLTRISAQGTNPCNFGSIGNGSSWIKCSVNAGCGAVELFTLNVYSGKPIITNLKVDGSNYTIGMPICPGNHWLSVVPVGYGAGNASWTVPSGIAYFVGNNTLDFTFPSNLSNLTILSQSSNSCGTGPSSSFVLNKKTSGCTMSSGLFIYPNPSDDVINVLVIDENINNDSINVSTSTNFLVPETLSKEQDYNINVFSSFGIKSYTSKSQQRHIKIPVSDLEEGTYFIEIFDGLNTYSGSFVVDRK